MNVHSFCNTPLELRAPKGRGFAKQSAAKWGGTPPSNSNSDYDAKEFFKRPLDMEV